MTSWRRFPTTGWPAGLFGRRDRLLLVLHAQGLPPRALTSLTSQQLSITRQLDNREQSRALLAS